MANVALAQPVLASPTSRRQYRSCDNCRSRRRKCDAVALGIDPHSARSPHNNRACTTCVRLGRACTFTWLIERKGSRAVMEGQNSTRLSISGTKRKATTPMPGDPSFIPSTSSDISSTIPTVDAVSSQSSSESHTFIYGEPYSRQYQDVNWSRTTPDARDGPRTCTPIDWNAFIDQPEVDISTPEFYGDGIELSTQKSGVVDHDHSHHHNPTLHGFVNHALPSPKKTLSLQSSSHPLLELDLGNERFATRANNRSITDIFISIYRANLEGVFSSWSTILTCPYAFYNSERATSKAEGYMTFYDRVHRMDGSIHHLGLEKVMPYASSHRGMESQVLNKVILAFASQWDSTSSPRQDSVHDTFSQTLQAVMHRTLWHEAHRALQKVAGPAGSFRIILARLIFSFVHSPLEKDQPINDQLGSGTTCGLHSMDPDARQIEDVCASITSDPACMTQMEMALRDILDWRRRLHTQFRTTVELGNHLYTAQQSFLDDFNTIFWLSVMYDTTASAISGRPHVISDDDCAIEQIYPESRLMQSDLAADDSRKFEIQCAKNRRKYGTSLWKSVLTKDMNSAPYPFPSDNLVNLEATIRRAIPLKVLLFRHISTLQVLIDQKAADHLIENAIQDALLVQRQWQKSYGDFLDACLDQYVTIPDHLRSWHTILMAHWHYGVMLVADKVQTVDKMRPGQGQRYYGRNSPDGPTILAWKSAMKVAKIAQCCLETSRLGLLLPDQGRSQLAMLSEPWSELMVRSLAMTAKTLLRSYVPDSSYLNGQDFRGRLRGIKACIEVLEELGACRYKTASSIARFLANELDSMPQFDDATASCS